MKYLLFILSLSISSQLMAKTVPHTFNGGDKITVEKINENFRAEKKICILKEMTGANAHAGITYTAGSRFTRRLSTMKGECSMLTVNPADRISSSIHIGGNYFQKFTLNSGKYHIRLRVSGGHSATNSTAILRNLTDAQDLFYTMSSYNNESGLTNVPLLGEDIVILNANKEISIEQVSSTGGGNSYNAGYHGIENRNIYATIIIEEM